ncbi:MAG: hypothetical protein DI543_21080 [Bradyrhizobium icense]|nr:MAG: hypothetical protein DI543_21080 [Bradyrhizobium icense]
MNNRVNEVRKQIRALRLSMLEAESVMREQINRDQDCSFVATEVLKMRGVMSRLVIEKEALGDYEPIFVTCAPIRRPKPVFSRPVKRQPEPARAG